MVFTTEGFLEVAIESWTEWDMNPRPLNSVQALYCGQNVVLLIFIYFSLYSCLMIFGWTAHCLRNIQIRSYFWSIFSCSQSTYRKKRTRKNSVFRHFSHSGNVCKWNGEIGFFDNILIHLIHIFKMSTNIWKTK